MPKVKVEPTVLSGVDMNDGMETLVLQCPTCFTLCRFARRHPGWVQRETAENARHFMGSHDCDGRQE